MLIDTKKVDEKIHEDFLNSFTNFKNVCAKKDLPYLYEITSSIINASYLHEMKDMIKVKEYEFKEIARIPYLGLKEINDLDFVEAYNNCAVVIHVLNEYKYFVSFCLAYPTASSIIGSMN